METAYGEISDLAGDIQVKIGGRLDRVDWTYSTATSCFMASGLSPWQRHLKKSQNCPVDVFTTVSTHVKFEHFLNIFIGDNVKRHRLL